MPWVKAIGKASLKPLGHVGTVAPGRVINLDDETAKKAIESGAFKAADGPEKKSAPKASAGKSDNKKGS